MKNPYSLPKHDREREKKEEEKSFDKTANLAKKKLKYLPFIGQAAKKNIFSFTN